MANKGERRAGTRIGCVAAAVAALLWPAPPPATAQQAGDTSAPPAAYLDQVAVELVTVDVWVYTRQGVPVTGLEPRSFEVFHDGQAVPISHFMEVKGGVVASTRRVAEPPGAGEAPDADEGADEAAPPSHLVVYFDSSRLHPNNGKRLVRGIEELLSEGAFEPERVLILRQDRSLSVEAPFGSTEEDLRKALKRLERASVGGLDLENESRQAISAIRSVWERSQDTVASAAGGLELVPGIANPTGEPAGGGSSTRSSFGGGGPGGPDACGSFVNQVEPILDSWGRSRGQRTAVTLSNLADAASFLAGLPGVKTLLYLSDGLDTQPSAALATYASSLCPSAGIELLTSARSEDMTDQFIELTRHANTNRVTIHSIQASGLQAPGSTSASTDQGIRGGVGQRSSGSFETQKRAADQDGLVLVASQTGGRAVFERNELGPELIRIGEASRNYYSLAYQPPAPSGRGDLRSHRIEVELADDSMIASYRRGYREKDPERWLSERVEGALNLGITSNPLGVRLGAGALRPGAGGNHQLPLHVMVPVERLVFLPRDGGSVAEVKLKVMTRNLASNVLALTEKSFRVRGAPGMTGAADLPILLELTGGAHVAAVGVQDQVSREASFVSTTLEIGDEGSRGGG